MRAVILIDSESRRPGDGATAIRLAARLRARGTAPLTTVCFLHDARPTFAESLEWCASRGATELVLAPYVLEDRPLVHGDLLRLREAAGVSYPGLAVHIARPLDDHPVVAQVLLQRAAEADYIAAHPFLAEHAGAREDVGEHWRPLYVRYPEPGAAAASGPAADAPWRPMYASEQTALLIAAPYQRHYPRHAAAGRSAYSVAERIRRQRRYTAVRVCLVGQGEPSIGASLDDLAGRGIRHTIAVPYTLQRSDPLIDRLAWEVTAAQAGHPERTLLLAEHLTYDRRLVDALADRVGEALRSLPRAG